MSKKLTYILPMTLINVESMEVDDVDLPEYPRQSRKRLASTTSLTAAKSKRTRPSASQQASQDSSPRGSIQVLDSQRLGLDDMYGDG